MDEDGDWVTIQDSSDLQFAIQVYFACWKSLIINRFQCVQQRNESTLKLRIGGNQGGIPDEIVNELKSIRDMSISLLGNCNKYIRKCTVISFSAWFLTMHDWWLEISFTIENRVRSFSGHYYYTVSSLRSGYGLDSINNLINSQLIPHLSTNWCFNLTRVFAAWVYFITYFIFLNNR